MYRVPLSEKVGDLADRHIVTLEEDTYLIKQNLDALTAIPRILSEKEICIKITLPLLWTYSFIYKVLSITCK